MAYYRKMIGFLIRKNFYDSWDNMFRLVLVNLGFIASLAIPLFLPGLIPVPILAIAVAAAGILWCCIYLSAAALSVKAISDYGSFGFADFGANLKAGWKTGLAIAIIGFIMVNIVTFSIPFYLDIAPGGIEAEADAGQGSRFGLFGFFLAAVIFWAMALLAVSFQFFFAVRARLDTKIIKIVKKCLIIFFDNPGFAMFSLLHTLFSAVLSLTILALLIPGPAGMLLFLDQGLRLRLLKYDWLEANPAPEQSKKKRSIPWDAILIEEREKTGTRTLRNFIFPWKD